jgi:hypothetical protein
LSSIVRLDTLYPEAAVKDLPRGLQGLLWDPVASMPGQARENWGEPATPVAVAAFNGTSSDFWLGQGLTRSWTVSASCTWQ